MDLSSYISGFTDGEGCFSVSFNLRNKLNTGIEVRPSFSISQNKKNLNLLKKINNYFKCGSIRYSQYDRCYKYEVRKINDLCKRIIVHFKKFPLIGCKKDDFGKFEKICTMVNANLHRNKENLEIIIKLAYNTNQGKRKYTQEQLLKHIAR